MVSILVLSDSRRTIASTHSLLNGILSNSPNSMNIALNLTIVPRPIDPFAMNLMNHRLIASLLNEMEKEDASIQWNQEANLILQKYHSIVHSKGFTNLFDSIQPRICHGKPLPCTNDSLCISHKEATKIFEMAQWKIWKLFGSEQISRARAGMFLNVLNTANPVNIFSVHDTTLYSLLGALQRPGDNWPGYASSVLVEIWENESGNFARVVTDGTPITLPWCQNKVECPLEQFKIHVNSIVMYANS